VDAQGRQVSLPQAPLEQTFFFSSANPFAITTLHWGTVDNTDINTVRRLGILGDILGDRMRVHVREEAGESYSPYAFNRSTSFEDFGYIRAFSGVHPDSIGLVTDLILEQAAALTIEGTNDDELQRMLEPVKSRVPIQRRTNRYWLSNVLLRSQAEPQRLDWARTYPDFWDTVTVDQINDLATEYLQPNRAIILHIVPQS
jgi:predicted Zn-dependent peptidase